MAADKISIVAKKRKKFSKKSKRSWRKHTDIKDIEEHLEEVRREERTGGSVANKPNEKIFFVDKDKTEDQKLKQDQKVTKRSKKRKILKADQLLMPDPLFKPVGSKKRKVNKRTQRVQVAGEDSNCSESEDEPAKVKRKRVNTQSFKTVAVYDLWATQEKHDGDEHYLRTTRKVKVKAPKTLNRITSHKAAVEVPVPGASYNPSYDDYQELLQAAHNVEAKKVKETKKIDRQLKFPTAAEMAMLPTWEEEMSQGLFGENDDVKDDDGDGNEAEGVLVKPVRAINRKTKQERTKQKEQKEENRKVKDEKEKGAQNNQVFRLKTINKEIRNREKELERRKRQKKEKQKKYADEPKRLGKLKYEPPEIELKLSNELTGNIRTLKPEGNLFEDRFKSFQRRNIIEPRKRVFRHRKYPLKEYVRRSSKKPCIKEI